MTQFFPSRCAITPQSGCRSSLDTCSTVSRYHSLSRNQRCHSSRSPHPIKPMQPLPSNFQAHYAKLDRRQLNKICRERDSRCRFLFRLSVSRARAPLHLLFPLSTSLLTDSDQICWLGSLQSATAPGPGAKRAINPRYVLIAPSTLVVPILTAHCPNSNSFCR